jgi:hypothetical protein
VAARVHKDSQLPQRHWPMEPEFERGMDVNAWFLCHEPTHAPAIADADCWDRRGGREGRGGEGRDAG